MRRRFRIVLILCLVVAASFTAWLVLKSRQSIAEPIYQNKPLSYWLDQYWIGDGNMDDIIQTNRSVDVVIRKIGTNAIPALLQMLKTRDIPLDRLQNLAQNHGFYTFRIVSETSAVRRQRAAMAFQALGPDARDAVPQLIDLLDQSRSDNRCHEIATSLGGIGPAASNAVPLLLQLMTNNSLERLLPALGEIHSQPEKVVPVLTNLLTNQDFFIRLLAVRDLQQFGAVAQPAVPALVHALSDPRPIVARYAAEALKAVDPAAAAQAGVK